MDPDRLFELEHGAADLAAAGETGRLRALLLDLDRMREKVNALHYPALDEDLALLDTDPDVGAVRVALRAAADVLEPLRPAGALRATLLARLPPAARAAVVAATDPAKLAPRLDPLWPVGGGAGRIARTVAGSDEVTVLLAFPDGRRLLRGDDRGRAAVFDVELGELVTTLDGHRDAITAAAITPDGRRVATADARGWLRLRELDRASGHPVAPGPVVGVHGGVGRCAFTADGARLVTVTHDGTPALWDDDLRAAGEFESPPEPSGVSPFRDVGTLVVAPGGQWLAAQLRGAGNGAYVWATATGRLLRHRSDIGILGPAADGGLLVAHRGDVAVWDPVTGRITATPGRGWLARGITEKVRWHLQPRRGKLVAHIAADPAARWLARVDQVTAERGDVVSSGATLVVHDRVRDVVHRLDIPGEVGVTVTGPDGAWLAAGADGGLTGSTVHLWRPGGEPRLLGEHAAPVTIAAAGGRGDWLATADRYGTTRLWPVDEAAAGARPVDLAGAMVACAGPRTGDWFVTADFERTAYLVAGGRMRHRLTGRERVRFVNGVVVTCVVAPDGGWLATADDDGSVSFWDPVTGRRTGPGDGHTGQVHAADAAATWLATTDRDGGVLVWTPFSTRPRRRFDLGEGNRGLLRADPGGDWLAVAGDGPDVHLLWPGHTGGHRVVRMPDDVTALDVRGPDLVVGDAAGGVHLVAARDGRRRPVHRAPAPIRHFAADPRLTWLACVAQEDGGPARIDVLRAGVQEPVAVIDRHVEPVAAARAAPDGRLLATVSRERTLRIWDVHTGRAVAGIRLEGALTGVHWTGPATIAVAGNRGAEVFRLVT